MQAILRARLPRLAAREVGLFVLLLAGLAMAAVTTVRGIGTVVGDIHRAAASIAAAIEAASRTGKTSLRVRGAARDFAGRAEQFRGRIGDFLQGLRAA